MKLSKVIKASSKAGDAIGNVNAARNGGLTKHLVKKKAKKSFFGLFK